MIGAAWELTLRIPPSQCEETGPQNQEGTSRPWKLVSHLVDRSDRGRLKNVAGRESLRDEVVQ